jgi:hypothetical protein
MWFRIDSTHSTVLNFSNIGILEQLVQNHVVTTTTTAATVVVVVTTAVREFIVHFLLNFYMCLQQYETNKLLLHT